MADSSLDDFFAKRDRNKKSKNKKFTTSDQIAKKLEESGKKSTEMATKKEKEKVVTSGSVPVSASTVAQLSDQPFDPKQLKGEDEEWRDFEEEKEKDYSGLKIHNLQIVEPKEEELDRDRSQDLDEDGEPVKPREGNTGPWNKITPSGVAPVTPPPQPVIVEEKKEEIPVKSSVYRPPHARLSSTPTSSGPTQRSSKNMKNAPEIGSELHFPSLSAAIESSKGSKKGSDRGLDSERGFESVKRGSRTNEESVSRGPRLDLGNKFDALSHGEMS